MLYAILAYHAEGAIADLTPDEDAALMTHLVMINERLESERKLGPAARLDFTRTARTLRGEANAPIMDGPFAETKEQLLGLYMINCASMEEAEAIAREFKAINKTAVYEIRPVSYYSPGAPMD
ncbi:MAG: YciI family protein [Rhizobiaceae bacterium]|nr:YciI family protein [Rhizobiaceae bacterium]